MDRRRRRGEAHRPLDGAHSQEAEIQRLRLSPAPAVTTT